MYIEIIDSEKYKGNVKPGKYEITSLDEGTNSQNRLFHKLLHLYFISGQHSYNAKNLEDFKIKIKNSLGEGKKVFWDHYDDNGIWHEEPIKKTITLSWRDYKKAQRMKLISAVLSEMDQCGFLENENYMVLRDQLEKNSMSRVTA